MPLTAEQARDVADLRLTMIQNMQKDLPPEHGIDKERLRAALDAVRQERSLGDTTGSKAKAKAPSIPLDLDAFMNKK